MDFEVKIVAKDAWVLRSAGIETDAYQDLSQRILLDKVKLPAAVTCSYFLSDDPVEIQVTVLAFGHLKIEVADDAIGKNIYSEILRFSRMKPENIFGDSERQLIFERIEEILKPDGVTSEDVEAGRVTLSRRAQEALMGFCDEVHFIWRRIVYWQFTKCEIAKVDRAFVAHWLVERFKVEKDPSLRDDICSVFMNHSDLMLRELAGQVIGVIEDSRYGTSRNGMIYVLAKTKHLRAAEVFASVMDEDWMTRAALKNLGILKAKQFEPQIRKYLRDTDAETRLEAKRALKKIGCLVEKAPPPIHLVNKSRKSIPKGLKEWSANLDFENLEPVLKTLAAFIDEGFSTQEVAEVIGVAEETRPGQTKAFRFSITAKGKSSELWAVIFMDDIDSPDLGIYASTEVIQKLEATVNLTD